MSHCAFFVVFGPHYGFIKRKFAYTIFFTVQVDKVLQWEVSSDDDDEGEGEEMNSPSYREPATSAADISTLHR